MVVICLYSISFSKFYFIKHFYKEIFIYGPFLCAKLLEVLNGKIKL